MRLGPVAVELGELLVDRGVLGIELEGLLEVDLGILEPAGGDRGPGLLQDALRRSGHERQVMATTPITTTRRTAPRGSATVSSERSSGDSPSARDAVPRTEVHFRAGPSGPGRTIGCGGGNPEEILEGSP